MKKAPLISIVLPIYNIENYLRVCMDSILNQTYSNLEIIMVDDGSTDKCSMICDEYMKMDKRIIVYHKKKRRIVRCKKLWNQPCKGRIYSVY